jgi:hypothetical protein
MVMGYRLKRLIGALLLLGLMVAFYSSSRPPAQSAAIPASKQAEQTQQSIADTRGAFEDAIKSISLGLDWRKGGFGSVAVANFTVTNYNPFAIKDVRVRCTFYSKSGTELNRDNVTLYEVFGASKTKKIRDLSVSFINQQAATGSCKPTDFARAD